MTQYMQVATTVEKQNQAENLAESILNKRLAACVQISTCKSMYHWQGALESADEYILTMKTRKDLFGELERYLVKIHPYDVPEILATEILYGSEKYLDWLEQELVS